MSTKPGEDSARGAPCQLKRLSARAGGHERCFWAIAASPNRAAGPTRRTTMGTMIAKSSDVIAFLKSQHEDVKAFEAGPVEGRP